MNALDAYIHLQSNQHEAQLHIIFYKQKLAAQSRGQEIPSISSSRKTKEEHRKAGLQLEMVRKIGRLPNI